MLHAGAMVDGMGPTPSSTPAAADCEDAHDAGQAAATGNCQCGSDAGDCDVASSDYRFVYLGCKVAAGITILCCP